LWIAHLPLEQDDAVALAYRGVGAEGCRFGGAVADEVGPCQIPEGVLNLDAVRPALAVRLKPVDTHVRRARRQDSTAPHLHLDRLPLTRPHDFELVVGRIAKPLDE